MDQAKRRAALEAEYVQVQQALAAGRDRLNWIKGQLDLLAELATPPTGAPPKKGPRPCRR